MRTLRTLLVLVAIPAAPLAAQVAATWEAAVRTEWSGPEPGAEFGAAVACGDLNEDGWPEICVGAPGENDGAGAVHVLDGKELTERVVLRGLQAGDRFGQSLAVTDWNRDSHLDLVIGAPGLRDATGAVYVAIDARKAKPGPPVLVLTGQRPGDRLGWSVSSAPARGGGLDVQGLLVGAPGFDGKGGDDCGRALYLLTGGKGKAPTVAREWLGSAPFAELGAFVARSSYITEKLEWMLFIGEPGAPGPDLRDLPRRKAGKTLPPSEPLPEEAGLVHVIEGGERDLLVLRGEAAGERLGTAAATIRLHGEGVQYGEFVVGGNGLTRVFSRKEPGRPVAALQPDPGETGFGLNVADLGRVDPSYQFAFVVATLRAPSNSEVFTGLRIVSGENLAVLLRVARPPADRYGAALASLRNGSDPTASLVAGAPGREQGRGAVELLDVRRTKR